MAVNRDGIIMRKEIMPIPKTVIFCQNFGEFSRRQAVVNKLLHQSLVGNIHFMCFDFNAVN